MPEKVNGIDFFAHLMKAIAIKLMFNLTVNCLVSGKCSLFMAFKAAINWIYADMVKRGFC